MAESKILYKSRSFTTEFLTFYNYKNGQKTEMYTLDNKREEIESSVEGRPSILKAKFNDIQVEGRYHCDDSSKKILKSSKAYLIESMKGILSEEEWCNLSSGYGTNNYTPKENFNEKFDYQMQYLLEKYEEKQKKLSEIAHVFTTKGVLTKLLQSPEISYNFPEKKEKQPVWRIAVLKVAGVLFMMECNTGNEIEVKESDKYCGARFEMLVTSSSKEKAAEGKNRIEQPINCQKREYVVICSSLVASNTDQESNKLQLWYSGQEDCVDPDGKSVELKSLPADRVKEENDKINKIKYADKARQIWAQVVPFGIERIRVGLKQIELKEDKPRHIVKEIVDISTESLRSILQTGLDDNCYNEQEMLDALYFILAKIKKELRGDRQAAFIEKYEVVDSLSNTKLDFGRKRVDKIWYKGHTEIRMISQDFNVSQVNFLHTNFLDMFEKKPENASANDNLDPDEEPFIEVKAKSRRKSNKPLRGTSAKQWHS